MKQKQFFTNESNYYWSYAKNKVFEQINSKNFPSAFFSIIGILTNTHGQARGVAVEIL